ncbi:DUF4962 domain-containing protein, partial [uncultured Victivallis sp.]|uniref:DUF4962 domain-containing protein n=1 Tax=uncultured Victivallis sp. TaxID=354118 RepID=UPI0025E8ECFE
MKKLAQKREGCTVFPAPEPEECVALNPPSLQWVPEPGAASYRVTVRDDSGRLVAERECSVNFLRFSAPFAPGRYTWNVFACGAERGEWAFVLPEDAELFLPPTARELLDALPRERPRHIYFPEDLAPLAAAYGRQLDRLERNRAIAFADGIMRYPDFWRPEGGRIDYRSALDEVRRFLDRDTVACALLWLFRRDREAGEFARRALLAVCEWNPAGPCSVSGEWGDEIGLSIVRTLPAVFDWVYELLSAKERNWAAATLRQHARQVHELLTNGNYAGNAGRSHSGRLPAYLGELALVLHGMIPEEECERYLAYALDLYGSIFPHYGGRDGGWAEGVFYASSYTKWYLPFFFAVERLSGFSFFAKPFYRHVAEFFLHFAVPGMKCHPFGDGHWDTRTEWPGFQAQNPFGVYADRFGPELARNFSRRCDEAIDHYELHLLDVIVPPPRAKLRELPRIGSDRSYVSLDTGLASLHTDLAHPERDIAMYARASRYGTPSHQHADQGDFAILAGGRGLIVPSGSFGYQFGEPHHRVWTQQTVSANCVLIDGSGQKKESAEATARMEPELERGKVSRLKLHLEPAYPMLRRYLRTLEFNHETGVLTVTDEIEADHPAVVDWR